MKKLLLLLFVLLCLWYFLYNSKPSFEPKMIQMLDSKTCERIIQSKDNYKMSAVSNGNKVQSEFRTSKSCHFQAGENADIDKIVKNICDMLNLKSEQIEPVQMTRYSVGEEYKYHYDYFKSDHVNQRHYTIVIYLNDDYDGGCTAFPYSKKFQPVQGNALIWSNLNFDNTVNTQTLHAGQPVLKGTKYILTVWTKLLK